jgi:hypothetical protein
MSANRVVGLEIYCSYCILRDQIMIEVICGGHDACQPGPPRIHPSKGWQDDVKSAVLHAIALTHYAMVYVRAWAADSIQARGRLAAENDRLDEECVLLSEELRSKDSRMAQIACGWRL